MDVHGQILKRIEQSKALLFLGSGSTVNCKTPDGCKGGVDGVGLAEAILTELNGGTSPGFPSNLMEASEFWTFSSAGGRASLDEFVQKRLSDLQATVGHLLATTFPWRAVITTNFNRVIEDAWGAAHMGGYAAGELIAIKTDDELKRHAPKQGHIRLYKPHGCVTLQMQQEHRMVLTSQDYCMSRSIRPKIYEEIEALFRDCTTVFIGYSLADYTFRNTFYQKHLEMKEWNSESYCVGPVRDSLKFEWQRESMKQIFRTTLVNDCFDTFMLRLVLKAGKLHPTLKGVIEKDWSVIQADNGPSAAGLSLAELLALPGA